MAEGIRKSHAATVAVLKEAASSSVALTAAIDSATDHLVALMQLVHGTDFDVQINHEVEYVLVSRRPAS